MQTAAVGVIPHSAAAPLPPERISQFEGRVPRYTSYPTAPHFSNAVTAETYAEWLTRLPEQQAISLYLHLPFCQRLCWYCGCHTTVVSSDAPIHAYIDLMLHEIDLVAKRIGRRLPIEAIHFGGGTPSMTPHALLLSLLERLRQYFDLSTVREIAMEIDPRGVSPARVAELARLPLTRASIGVQDFDPQVQEIINRRQSFKETAQVVRGLRKFGVSSINLDLIYGLPAQTHETLARTIDLSLSLSPDRLTLFGYAHVPWMKKHQALIAENRLPSPIERYALYQAAADRIVRAGYVRIGFDHFAKPEDEMALQLSQGRLRRNFQGYTTDQAETLLGFGASSISALPEGYSQNLPDSSSYRTALVRSSLPVARGISLSAEDKLRRAVIERLMCDLTVDLAAMAKRFQSKETFEKERLILADPPYTDLVSIHDSRVTLKEAARPLVRSIATVFDAYVALGAKRYSQAV